MIKIQKKRIHFYKVCLFINETLRICIRSRTGIPDQQEAIFTDLDGEVHKGYRWVNLGAASEKEMKDSLD